jgi:hypothetical protein
MKRRYFDWRMLAIIRDYIDDLVPDGPISAHAIKVADELVIAAIKLANRMRQGKS